MLQIGTKTPEFELASSSGGKLSSADLRGHNAVVVFYPKNNTLFCNIQLARLEKYRRQFELSNTKVLAINSAPAESHQKFCRQKHFNFPILSDPDKKVLAQFDAQRPNGQGVVRTVYAIDKEGKVISARRGMGKLKQLVEFMKGQSS